MNLSDRKQAKLLACVLSLWIVEQRDDQVLLSYESPRKCSPGHNHALDSKK